MTYFYRNIFISYKSQLVTDKDFMIARIEVINISFIILLVNYV